ncbi:Got1-domain-containing protein [Terfezia boudieri ATCC MYA-4762]|uniref:Got1-domain-containing protein n=1 Tax=Terfezia boudieri ATCC MYA-4762 TaxID=1051890 RepID=A0A3N4LL11_9PEZI|nr:Got1-domain-containing protein [Terfezia boudieri ATCC MYA-4762]
MWMSDTQKIGAAFTGSGTFFLFLGLMFFFDRALILMGNILLLLGITVLLGPTKTFTFFAKKEKLKGTAAFIVGLAFIIARWPMIGFVVECYGLLLLFKDFFGVLVGFIGSIPIVGPYIEGPLARITGTGRVLPV